MIDIIDFSNWKEYDGASEGSGRSEKVWLQSDDGQIGVFKFPKIDPSNKETTEHISEHLAYKIGEQIGVQTAKVDIGRYNGRIGSMSYLVCNKTETLTEGIWYISAKYPKYNIEKMQDEDGGKYYCIEHLFGAISNLLPNIIHIEMMLFDFLIGNSDRHHSNWAVLTDTKIDGGVQKNVRQCPLYDNGSSLCCYIKDEDVPSLLGKDKARFNALVDSKSKSIIRINGNEKRTPTHKEVIEYLFENYAVSKEIAKNFLQKLSNEAITNLLCEYQQELLTREKRELICRFLNKKVDILREILERG